MYSRREWLALAAGSAASLRLTPGLLDALRQGTPITRAIPKAGEKLPVIGLGSSATFSQVARGEDVTALKEVLAAMTERGGRVFDTAPSYGASEQVAAGIANELGLTGKLFWATKVNVAGRGAGAADPAAARAQVERSLALYQHPLDCLQVHNMGDPATQLAVAREFKAAGRVRYVGITTTFDGQYGQLEAVMKAEPLDFIGIDYAIDNRGVEERILPLAQEKGIAVLAYAPFGRTSLFQRAAAAGQPLPDWATEFGATTWAQFFLKFILTHPAVTAITPATSRRANLLDNLAGGVGAIPDAKTRARMIALVDGWPAAPGRGR
jgi:aryl-alcohol dehydrogenase-like predicted oxidoreductase